MKTRYSCSLLIFCFLGIAAALQAQKTTDLKVDLFTPFLRTARLTFEYAPTRHWGLEAGMAYTWKLNGRLLKERTGNIDAMPLIEDMQVRALIMTAAARYYFTPKHGADGLFLGMYGRLDHLIHTYPPGYDEYDALTVESYQTATLNFLHRNTLRAGFGATIGYKWRISEHFLAEVSVGYDVDPFIGHDFEGLPAFLSIGYRF
jgi:hypothetical protein